MFFNICDDDRDGILDASKLKKVVKLGLSKEEKHIMTKDKEYLKNKIQKLIELIRPPKRKEIREQDVIDACMRSPELIKIIDGYLNLPNLFKTQNSNFSISSFIHNQT